MLIFWILFGLVICFGFVLLFGAPYVPIHAKQARLAVELADLSRGDKFYELGCGDGKMLILAAKTGAQVVGVELNPILFLVSKLRTFKRPNIKVLYGSFWSINLSDADVVFVFLLNKFMTKLDKKLTEELKPESKLISYVFMIPDKEIINQKESVYLYKY